MMFPRDNVGMLHVGPCSHKEGKRSLMSLAQLQSRFYSLTPQIKANINGHSVIFDDASAAAAASVFYLQRCTMQKTSSKEPWRCFIGTWILPVCLIPSDGCSFTSLPSQ